ncbi:hypothetical protein [Nonomuraea sp. SYSU D8015]|uniref:hypothetical protein n=1 Tax=Nonomuraea sp. SYSU D8015 TaxID=2593644 RepID=UPI001CB7163F|nr:hypothetical protein [Nonomuraea sp. SYSU D8015]
MAALESGTGADGLALPAAVLGLLSVVAADQPVLACVDDVDRLDAASRDVLAFVARRVAGEPIALLFAARDRERGPEGVAVRVLGGLDETAVRELAGDVAPVRPTDDLLAALNRTARGNPLALGELIASLTADQFTGLAAPPTTLPRTGVERPGSRSFAKCVPGTLRSYSRIGRESWSMWWSGSRAR